MFNLCCGRGVCHGLRRAVPKVQAVAVPGVCDEVREVNEAGLPGPVRGDRQRGGRHVHRDGRGAQEGAVRQIDLDHIRAVLAVDVGAQTLSLRALGERVGPAPVAPVHAQGRSTGHPVDGQRHLFPHARIRGHHAQSRLGRGHNDGQFARQGLGCAALGRHAEADLEGTGGGVGMLCPHLQAASRVHGARRAAVTPVNRDGPACGEAAEGVLHRGPQPHWRLRRGERGAGHGPHLHGDGRAGHGACKDAHHVHAGLGVGVRAFGGAAAGHLLLRAVAPVEGVRGSGDQAVQGGLHGVARQHSRLWVHRQGGRGKRDRHGEDGGGLAGSGELHAVHAGVRVAVGPRRGTAPRHALHGAVAPVQCVRHARDHPPQGGGEGGSGRRAPGRHGEVGGVERHGHGDGGHAGHRPPAAHQLNGVGAGRGVAVLHTRPGGRGGVVAPVKLQAGCGVPHRGGHALAHQRRGGRHAQRGRGGRHRYSLYGHRGRGPHRRQLHRVRSRRRVAVDAGQGPCATDVFHGAVAPVERVGHSGEQVPQRSGEGIAHIAAHGRDPQGRCGGRHGHGGRAEGVARRRLHGHCVAAWLRIAARFRHARGGLSQGQHHAGAVAPVQGVRRARLRHQVTQVRRHRLPGVAGLGVRAIWQRSITVMPAVAAGAPAALRNTAV